MLLLDALAKSYNLTLLMLIRPGGTRSNQPIIISAGSAAGDFIQIEASKNWGLSQSSQDFHHHQTLQVNSKDHEGLGVAASSIAVAELSAKVSKLCL